MRLCFTSSQAVLMVIAEELVQEIDGFVRDISLIFGSNEASPRFPLVPARPSKVRRCVLVSNDSYSPSQDLIVLCIELDIIFFKVCIQLVCSQDLGNFHKLVVVIMAMEEGFLPENLSP